MPGVPWRKNFGKDTRVQMAEYPSYFDEVVVFKTGDKFCILESSRIAETKQEKDIQD
ncbi:hypothetical protein BX616_006472, partial [Lobosporangium transversale]